MLKWVLIGIAAVVIGGCTAVVGGAYYLFQSAQATPEFYDEIEVVEMTPEERSESIADVRNIATTVLPARVFESAEVDGGRKGERDAVEAESENGNEGGGEDAKPNVSGSPPATPDEALADRGTPAVSVSTLRPFSLTLTETQLNTYVQALLAEYGKMGPAFSDPRIRLTDSGAKVGARVAGPDFSGVVAIDVVPEVRGPKEIAFLLQRISLGKVSIPVDKALVSADIKTENLPKGVRIPPDAQPPTLILSWDHLDDIATEIESAEVRDGELQIDLRIAPNEEHSEGGHAGDEQRPAA